VRSLDPSLVKKKVDFTTGMTSIKITRKNETKNIKHTAIDTIPLGSRAIEEIKKQQH
jgi:hypothetical protein